MFRLVVWTAQPRAVSLVDATLTPLPPRVDYSLALISLLSECLLRASCECWLP